MANTTNFGWETPDDTDLVKDGAAAMRTLGNSIDASFVDLKGGTTGQILSKNSNTDLDFTWIANDQGDITAVTAGTGISGGGTSGAVTITNSMATEITASGDIIVGTGSGTFDNLPIGTTGQVLTADTTVSPYKVKWATATTAAFNYSLINAGGTALTGASTVTVTGISGKQFLMIAVDGASGQNASQTIALRLNTDTGNNYAYVMLFTGASSGGTGNLAGDYIPLGDMGNSAANTVSSIITIDGCNATGYKNVNVSAYATGSSTQIHRVGNGYYTGTSTISSISIVAFGGQLDAGTVYVYGA